MTSIQIQDRHLKIIQKILNDFKMDAYVFGSRAKNTAKPFSDLDLCLKGHFEKSLVRRLQENFEESDLPFKVDIVIWDELDQAFRDLIAADLVPLAIGTK